MMDSWSDYYRRQTTHQQTTYQEEQYLYDHLLDCVKVERPDKLLERFHTLFIAGVGYSDYDVWRALERIVNSPFVEKDFKFILNRSCHILINHWLMQPKLHSAIPELVALFESVPSVTGHSRTCTRMRQLVQNFGGTEQYRALKRLAQMVHKPDLDSGTHPLGTLVPRYPCLYEYNLLTEDSSDEQRRRIRQMRRQAQRQLDQDLARYATYRLLNGGTLSDSSLPRDLRSHTNPTLLSDRQLDSALQQFGGKVDGSNTYRDLSQRFLTYSSRSRSYGAFKDDLYEFLTASIDPKYGKTQFNQRLYAYLQDTLPDHHDQRLNSVLMVGTCRKLLNFLIVESPQQPNHAMFVDLTGNLGIARTIGLLLKIVLICRNVKPYLEKQFALLFRHYETCARDGVIWLVESLEHLNVALSINFGTLSL